MQGVYDETHSKPESKKREMAKKIPKGKDTSFSIAWGPHLLRAEQKKIEARRKQDEARKLAKSK